MSLASLGALALALAWGPAGHAQSPGTVLPVAPGVPPGVIAPWPEDRLAAARERWIQGDAQGTIRLLEPWLADRRGGPRGRTRTSAHLLAGMAHLKLENNNLASGHFYRVRRTDGPLAPYGAWYEALVDHRRGRHLVAARECAAYREAYPEGIHAAECLLLEGEAHAYAGNRSTSYTRYEAYLEDHPDSPREEEIDVARVQAAALTAPSQAVRMAIALWKEHSYPSTDLAVTAILEELQSQGHTVTLPSDPASRIARCETLRRSGRFDEAWEMFQSLREEAPDNATIAAWVRRSEERFAWSTRNYTVFAETQSAQYAASPSGEDAWSIYTAYARAGMWDQAADWGRRALEAHEGHWRWRSEEPVARAEMLSGDYAGAHARFLNIRGADAAFLAAFCAYKAGELDTAAELFGPITERAGHWRAAAYYWRAQVRLAQGAVDDAQPDLAAAVEHDRSGWYQLLLLEPPAADAHWTRRDGRWHGAPAHPRAELPSLSGATPPPVASGLLPATTPVIHWNGKTMQGLLEPEPDEVDWSALSWPMTPPEAPPTTPPDSSVEVLSSGIIGNLPNGYTRCDWFEPDSALSNLYRLARRYGEEYEDLWAVHDLVVAGQHGEAARLVGPLYDDWKQRGDGPPLSASQWRELFLVTQAHHYAARYCAGMGRGVADEEARKAAQRLSYPIVRASELWAHSQRFNLDPLLMMGIMRQESSYQEFVVSHAGAIGLVQVMPRTGARVAALMGEQRYSPGDLEDPSINIRYGAFYMSRLMERFDGNYPLAIASYNGGPHNVSRWMRQIRGTVTLAEFVEHIPWEETRDYVKRVSGHYARYAALYGPADAALAIPGPPDKDDPSVIDF